MGGVSVGFMAVLVLAVWAFAFWRFRTLVRELPGKTPFGDIPWSGRDLLLCALTFFAFWTMGVWLFRGTTPSPDPSAWTYVGGFSAQLVGTAAVLVLLASMYRIRPDHFGLGRRSPFLSSVFFGVSAYVVFVPIVFLSIPFSEWLLRQAGHEFQPQEVVQVLLEKVRPGEGESGDPLLIGVFVVFTVVFVPVCEEFLFRGLLLGGLRRFMPTVPAIFLSSYFFALVHTVSTLIPIFALALIMGSVYERTRSLPAVIAIHALHNGVMVLGMFFVA